MNPRSEFAPLARKRKGKGTERESLIAFLGRRTQTHGWEIKGRKQKTKQGKGRKGEGRRPSGSGTQHPRKREGKKRNGSKRICVT